MSSMTSGVHNPLTQPLPRAGKRRKKGVPFMFLSPLEERLGEGVPR